MNRRTLLLLLAGSAAACAPQPFANPLSREVRASLTFADIVVDATGAGLESSRAADRASSLGPDLRAALRSEFSDRVTGSGALMRVDVARFNLAGGTTTAFGRDQSRLSASVRIIDPTGRLLATYTIQTTAGDAAETRTGALVGATIGSAERFYRTLLSNFARNTREQILGSDLPGQRLIRRATSG
jgi:hypothetical protein